jgi:glycosyltransferase involved in cell wall biosynthesis
MQIAMIGVKGIPHPGGIENVVEQLGTRLVGKGHEVTVYVRPHYTPRAQLEFHGMRLINLPSVATRHLDALTHTFLATAHAMSVGTDVAHVHSIGLSPFALPLRLRGIRTVVQSHGLDWQRQKWGSLAKAYLRASDRSALIFPHVTTAVSRTIQRYYEQQLGHPVLYIPNGVTARSKVLPDELLKLGLRGNDYILFASRLVPEKGLHYLLEAYKALRNPTKKLIVAGDSNYGDRYADTLKQNATDNILFLGFVTGRLLEELLSWAYLYVLPSEIEGLSTGLLEAMSYGNCVVVSNIPENLEVIENNGVPFERGQVGDLKAKLELLLGREEMVEQYRLRARKHVLRHYSWDDVADKYEKLYRHLLEAKAA